MAVSDILIEIGSLDGASGDSALKKAFGVTGWNLSVANDGAGGTDGKAHFSELHLTLETSKNLGSLIEQVAGGKKQPSVKLHARKTLDGKATECTTIELKDCLITSYSAAGSQGSGEGHSCSIKYNHIMLKTATVDDKAVTQGAEGKWDLLKGEAS